VPLSGGPISFRPRFLVGVVVAWSLIAFLPVVRNDFVNWDDFRMFLDNAAHRGSWADRLRGAWASHRLGEYMPVTWMSYGLDRSLWDNAAWGYHLTSLFLHAMTVLAVMALAHRFIRHSLEPTPWDDSPGVWIGATVAALSFAVHPLRVEAVAWVSARGTVLGGLLLVLTVLVYVLGWERGRASGRIPTAWLAGALALFALSLLARATGLVLPLVLVVLDVHPLRRLGGGPGRWLGRPVWPVWIEKIGFAALALLTVPMAYLARGEEVGDFWQFGYEPAIALAWGVYSLGFYVLKTVVPGTLGPVYPMPDSHDPMVPALLLGLAVIAAVTAVLTVLRRRWPGALTAWIVYGVMIAPLSGILPFGRLRGVADRYTYVACIGWAIVAGGAAAMGWRRVRGGDLKRAWAGAAAVAVVGILIGWSVLSWQQAKVWRNGITLWGWAEGVHRDSPVVQNNLGWAWAQAGEFQRAEVHVRRAAQAWPHNPAVLQTLGRIVAAQRRYEESAVILHRAVEVAPRWSEGRTDLGSVLYESGRTGPAAEQLQRAIQLDPDEARAHDYLGRALRAEGRLQEAEVHLRRAAELDGASPPDEPPGAAKGGPRTPPLRREPAGGGIRPYRRRAGAGGTPGRGVVTRGPRAGRSR
jgi:Flp pilus assembly protein TadD